MCRALIVLLISGLAGATLIRIAPGFGIDEQALDARLSPRSLEALEHERAGERNPLAFYLRFLAGLLHGEAGRSSVFGQPVAALIRERMPRTLGMVLAGLGLGWSAGVLLGAASVLAGRGATIPAIWLGSGILLSIPSAVLATACLVAELPPACAIAGVVFPRVFPHAYEQFRAAQSRPHVFTARARGLPATRVFLFHIVPTAMLPIVALAGVSAILAFGASIPIEALSDSPGIGQLAWRAALGRDVPVLVTITLMLTALTVLANMLTDIVGARLGRRVA